MVKNTANVLKVLLRFPLLSSGNPLLDFYGQYAAAAAAAGFPAVTQAMIAPSAAITQGTIDSNAMQGESRLFLLFKCNYKIPGAK
jgi:hypothetical protein